MAQRTNGKGNPGALRNILQPNRQFIRMKTQIEQLIPLLHSRGRWHSTPGSTAFTLVEMLVVISIIGILAALIIPAARLASKRKPDLQLKPNSISWRCRLGLTKKSWDTFRQTTRIIRRSRHFTMSWVAPCRIDSRLFSVLWREATLFPPPP